MENNPYYSENQAWMHTDPDAHLRMLQTQALERQEADRLHALYMRPTQSDFAGLQQTSDGFYPHAQHNQGGGVPWTGLALGAAAGYYLANRQQAQQQDVEAVRPTPRKASVWGRYIAFAIFVALVTGVMAISVPVWILVNLILWTAIGIVAVKHQHSIDRYNEWYRAALYQDGQDV